MSDLKWVIYYEGAEFSSRDGSPWDAPRQGVQIIAQIDSWVGYELIFGKDYFYYEEDRGGWQTCDQFGFYDHCIRAKYPCPLFGRMMSDEAFKEFREGVKGILGPKQGWKQKELRDGKVPE